MHGRREQRGRNQAARGGKKHHGHKAQPQRRQRLPAHLHIGQNGAQPHRHISHLQAAPGAPAALHQLARRNIAHHIGCSHHRCQRAGQLGRQTGLRVHGWQKAHHAHPLARIQHEGQRHQPGTGAFERQCKTRSPALLNRGGSCALGAHAIGRHAVPDGHRCQQRADTQCNPPALPGCGLQHPRPQ